MKLLKTPKWIYAINEEGVQFAAPAELSVNEAIGFIRDNMKANNYNEPLMGTDGVARCFVSNREMIELNDNQSAMLNSIEVTTLRPNALLEASGWKVKTVLETVSTE